MKSKILPKGYEIRTSARTVATEVIDGHEGHWYQCNIDVFDGYVYIGWVFGGYLSQFDERKNKNTGKFWNNKY